MDRQKIIDAIQGARAYLEAMHDSDPHGLIAGLDRAAEIVSGELPEEVLCGVLRTYFVAKVAEFKETSLGTELHKSEAILELCDRIGLEHLKAEIVEHARRELHDVLGTPGEVETVRGRSSWMYALAKPEADGRNAKWEALLDD